jgi:hypothetical protein
MKANVAAVYCEFKYSRVGSGLILLAASSTLGIVAATPMSGLMRASLALWIVAASLREHRKLREVRAIRVDGEDAIHLELAQGSRGRGKLRAGSLVAPWLAIVRWRPEGGRRDRALVIVPDMLAAGVFRRLRVLLRWA